MSCSTKHIVYVTDFNEADFARLKLSVVTAKHFCPEAKIHVLSYGKPPSDAEAYCRSHAIAIADCTDMLDSTFPSFKKHNTSCHWLCLRRPYPKTTFVRFLVPFVMKSGKALYLDNDTFVCRSLDSIFQCGTGYAITKFDDTEAQSNARSHYSSCRWLIDGHDAFRTFNGYANAGVLLFDCDMPLSQMQTFIKRTNIGQELTFAKCGKLLSDQDVLNLYAEAHQEWRRFVTAYAASATPDTCISHYYKKKCLPVDQLLEFLKVHLLEQHGMETEVIDIAKRHMTVQERQQ